MLYYPQAALWVVGLAPLCQVVEGLTQGGFSHCWDLSRSSSHISTSSMVMGAGGGKGIGTGVYQQIAAFAILADHKIKGLGSGFQLIKCHFDTVLSLKSSKFGSF